MDTFVVHLKHTKSLYDQDVLNMYKPQRYGLLDKNLFTNGFRFYENRHKHPVSRNLILVHHNWISGDSNKMESCKKFRLYPKRIHKKIVFKHALAIFSKMGI